MSKCIIFGGTGFIGMHFTKYLLENNVFDHIFLADIKPIQLTFKVDSKKVSFVYCDVRKEIEKNLFDSSVSLIVNLASIHREPGHSDIEFFETNLVGAENICNFANNIACKNIIFTSSISIYGISESIKNENTLPLPVTAYGSSKLVAEKIHQIWHSQNIERRLVIVRPGVVFGPHEGGNVSRLIRAVINRYFFFMGNKKTQKAGVYVKELCHAMWWVFQEQMKNGEVISLFNMTMSPIPTIGEYVESICKTKAIKRFVPSIPYMTLITISYLIDTVAKPLRISHPFSPTRIRKLVRSNNVSPNYLIQHGYRFQYSLDSAFMDWKQSCPEEFI